MLIPKPVVAILLAGALASAATGARLVRPSAPLSGPDSRVTGSTSARLSVTEYFDYQCGACRTAYNLLKEYERAFPGSIRLEMRFYPLPGHPFGLKAAIFADCAAAQGKFWPFHDRMMEHQPVWAVLPDPTETVRGYAAESGTDLAKLDTCTADPETEIRVLKEKEAGLAAGVKLTPSAFMNGEFAAGTHAIRDKLKQLFGEVKPSGEISPNPTSH